MANQIQSITSVKAVVAPLSIVGNNPCSLSVAFKQGVNVKYFDVFINDQEFVPNSGNPNWEPATGAIVVNGNYLTPPGVKPGDSFKVQTTSHFNDGTSQDSPVFNYTVEDSFVCTPAPVPAKPGKGKKK